MANKSRRKSVESSTKRPVSKRKAAVSTSRSKSVRITALLSRPGGATITELMKITGWQAHSIRGFISGTVAKKLGLAIESSKNDAGERTYRIAK